MRLAKFIQENRTLLKQHIREALRDPDFPVDTREIELWIASDETLYRWAKQSGVKNP